jgi:hypothetical protein
MGGRPIEIHDFLEHWIPGSKKDSRSFAVFPVPDATGVAVESVRLSTDLQEELDRVE